MIRFLRATLLFVPVLALTACASTVMVSSHVDRRANFLTYKTYSWGPADALPTGDPRLDKDPFFKDQVEGTVEKALALKHLALVKTGADLLVHYHANITERLDVTGIDRPYGYCIGEDCQAKVTQFEAGTLIIDVVDAKTNKLVWRGWARDDARKMLANHDAMARQINEAVPKIIAQFPKAF